MEIRKNPHRIFGRVFEQLTAGDLPRSADKSNNASIGKVSLTMGNEVLGEWLWTKENLK